MSTQEAYLFLPVFENKQIKYKNYLWEQIYAQEDFSLHQKRFMTWNSPTKPDNDSLTSHIFKVTKLKDELTAAHKL